ncbi:disease resistance (CC-NBS-LRR class) family protein, partial [Trifolium pratense]
MLGRVVHGELLYPMGCQGSKSNNASLEELRDLSHLTALDIMIQDASVWPWDLQ